MRTKLLIAVAVVCTVVPFAGQFYGDRAGGWLMIDFRAYYCAALAQREGRNPYFAASVHDCERQTPAPFYHSSRDVTVPAPYPAYALAVFYPFTFLPFGAAAVVWWIVLALSLAAAAYSLSRIAWQPFLVGWAAFVLSLGLVAWTSGNLVLVGVAALVVAAFLVQRGNFVLATVALLVAMIEPQVALPAAVALFVRYRELRPTLGLGFAVLAAVCLILTGFAQTLFYLTTVLPAHALSEVSRDNQYSIATVLTAFGISDTSAALIGSLSYVVMSAIGILLGLRLARRYGEPAMVVLVPPAISLLGGSFVHTGEIAAAVPATLLLFTHAREYRALIFLAVILLAVPWILATSAAMLLAPLFPAAYLSYALWERDRPLALATAIASFATIIGLFALSAVPGGHAASHHHAHPPIDPRLAEASWRQLVLGNTTNKPIMWLLRLPTWAGLIVFAGSALALARNAPLSIAASDAQLAESQA